MSNIVLENESLRLVFRRENGALVDFTAKDTGWEVLNRPHLGLSFQLMVPLPGRRNNPVHGEKQPVASAEVAADGGSVAFRWNAVKSAYGGVHNISLRLAVTLEGPQVEFALEIDNQSEQVVELAHCPFFGDVQPPPDAATFEIFHYGYATAERRCLYPEFENTLGYYGFDYPVQYGPDTWRSGAPMVPYVLLRSADQGLYVGIGDNSSELVAWTNELRPGYDSAIDSRVPEAPAIGGLDVASRFAAVHLPYIQPAKRARLRRLCCGPIAGAGSRASMSTSAGGKAG